MTKKKKKSLTHPHTTWKEGGNCSILESPGELISSYQTSARLRDSLTEKHYRQGRLGRKG